MSRVLGPALRLAFAVSAALVPAGAPAQTTQFPAVRDVAAELACGPAAVEEPPAAPARLGGGPTAGKALFGVGDTVVVRQGTVAGLEPGRQYFVRRIVPDQFTVPVGDGITLHSVHTAGWIRIDDVRDGAAAGVVVHACDALMEGDYLEPFEMPAVPDARPAGTADFANPGRLILGDERRQMGSAGSLMVIDRGSDHGLRPGQRVTIFRPWPGQGPVVQLGEGTAMIVRPETATVRIDASSDAIAVGDLAAIHR